MDNIEVYLTKSGEVANLISRGSGCDLGIAGVKRVTFGHVDSEEGRKIVPAMFQNKGYFFCAVFTENTGLKAQRYDLIVE